MSKYKVPFSGFVYVEAEDKDEALDMAQDGDAIYEETNWEHAVLVDDFTVGL
jgi:hypothetical protein